MRKVANEIVRTSGWTRFLGLGATAVVVGLTALTACMPLGPQVVFIPVVLWVMAAVVAYVVDSLAVEKDHPIAARTYTGLILFLPMLSCVWMVIGWVLAAMVQTWIRDQGTANISSDRLLGITCTIPPLASFALLSVKASLKVRTVERADAIVTKTRRMPRWTTALVFIAASLAIIVAMLLARAGEHAPSMAASIALGSLVVERAITLQMLLRAQVIVVCKRCGYDLRGLTGAVCPECGMAR